MSSPGMAGALLRQFVTAPALIYAIACAGSPAPDSGANADQQIRRQSAQHAEAWRQNDPARAASIFTENGVLGFPEAPDARGSAAVHDLLTAFFKSTHIDSIQVTPDTVEVYGNVAYEWGTYHEVYRPEGKPVVREEGRYVARWARDGDGEWRISRFTANTVHRSSGTIGRPGA